MMFLLHKNDAFAYGKKCRKPLCGLNFKMGKGEALPKCLPFANASFDRRSYIVLRSNTSFAVRHTSFNNLSATPINYCFPNSASLTVFALISSRSSLLRNSPFLLARVAACIVSVSSLSFVISASITP